MRGWVTNAHNHGAERRHPLKDPLSDRPSTRLPERRIDEVGETASDLPTGRAFAHGLNRCCTSVYIHVHWAMAYLTVSEARADIHKMLDAVERGDEVTLTRYGKAVAVVIRPDLVRVRRLGAALATAAEIQAKLESGRTSPLSGLGLTAERADELAEEVRADRSGR